MLKNNPIRLLLSFILVIGLNSVLLSQTPDKLPIDANDLPTQTGFIEVPAGKLYYELAGSGETIILIHDGLIHHEIWEGSFHEFARNYQVVRYDRRGYGKSPVPTESYSNVADLAVLFEQLKINQAILMGMSAGGGLCIDFTLAHPEKVRMLVLVGAVVSGMGYTTHFATRGGRIDYSFFSDTEKLIDYILNDDPYEIAPANSAARAKAHQMLANYRNNINPAYYQLRKQPERLALKFLNEITIPTLIIVGEFDIPDVHAHAGAIEAGISNARRVVIKDAGHLVPLEQLTLFNEQVLHFLQEAPFFEIIEEKGVAAAVQLFQEKRTQNPEWLPFSESRMNQLGYKYLQGGDVEAAIELFKLNVEAYPNSANVYDSLGEGYLKAGNNELAIENYQKSLTLNPQNQNAAMLLERLKTAKE